MELRIWKVAMLSWLLGRQVHAQAPSDPIKDFCRRFGHQTAVMDRKLYVDGGWVYANPISQNPVPVINTNLLYSDLDDIEEGMPAQHAGLVKNDTVPSVYGGTLWTDDVNKIFWLYGGQYSTPDPSPFQLWGYDTVLNQWNLSNVSGTVSRAAYGAGVSVSELGRGYYYGGYLNNQTVPAWVGPPLATSSMLIFDMDANTLTNITGPDAFARAEGVLLYIPASTSGLLVYFGGVYFPHGNQNEVPMQMSNIIIHDIGSATWHTQTATGSIPPNRRKFCAGATWASDQSSYQIYLYGGFGFGEHSTGYDDVYILSMPTFEWIKWFPDKPGITPYPQGDLTCNVIDNSQMIIMGGNFTYMDDCDAPAVQGQHNLNLGQEDPTGSMFYQFLPNVTSYQVPEAVLLVTGGSPVGGADHQLPPSGFTDPALRAFFQGIAAYPTRTPTRYISPTNIVIINPFQPKKEMGKIVAGCAVGGIALTVLAFTGFFCVIKRNNKKAFAGMGSVPTKGMLELGRLARHNGK